MLARHRRVAAVAADEPDAGPQAEVRVVRRAVADRRAGALDEVLGDQRARDRAAGAGREADAVLAEQRAVGDRLRVGVAGRVRAAAVAVDVGVPALLAADDLRGRDGAAQVEPRGRDRDRR